MVIRIRLEATKIGYEFKKIEKGKMIIEISLDYWAESVICFDPEKILWKLSNTFTNIVIDPVDYSGAEVEKVVDFIQQHHLPESSKSVMLSSFKRKALRNGPTYRFALDFPDALKIHGWARRYSVGFESNLEIPMQIKTQLIDFLESINFGVITISN